MGGVAAKNFANWCNMGVPPLIFPGLDGEVQMNRLSERAIRWIFGGVGLASFVLLLGLEIVTESDQMSPLDLVVDAVSILLTIGAAVGVALLVQRMHAQHEEKMNLIRDLEIARAEGERWRTKVQTHLAGIRVEMEKQFDQWEMTAAEQEVGMLMLKGLSHKEIAELRATAAATVRQQAQSIYQKSKLPSKTAFSAYFLEDLFAPDAVANEPVALRSAGS